MIRPPLAPTFYEALAAQLIEKVQTVESQISGKSGKISLAIHLQDGRIRGIGVSAEVNHRVDAPHEPI